jgi:predicted RNA-binding Zn ribbon-like protein
MPRAIPTGQWIELDGQPWWFDAGSVALDFAYAGGLGEVENSLAEIASLGSWLAARYPELATETTERDVLDARTLHDSLARAVAATNAGEQRSAEDVDVINLFAATPDIPPVLEGGSRRAGRTTARIGQGLSAIAREAVELFSPANADRIRSCAADDCELIFYDESRSNNRRWCSMQRCGNRAKVRTHRQRGILSGDEPANG